MIKNKKMETEKKEDLIIRFFGSIGIFGWFFAIWIPEYRWRIFFTCLLSLILSMITFHQQKERKEKVSNLQSRMKEGEK